MWKRLVIGVALLFLGGIWMGQGFGAIEGSFMTDNAEWIVIGGFLVAVGIAMLVGAARMAREARGGE